MRKSELCCPDSKFLWDRGLLQLYKTENNNVGYGIKAGPIELMYNADGCPFCKSSLTTIQSKTEFNDLKHKKVIESIGLIIDKSTELSTTGSLNLMLQPKLDNQVELSIITKIIESWKSIKSFFSY